MAINRTEINKVRRLLTLNGFEKVSEGGYDNTWVCIYPNYMGDGETVIISSSTGQELAFLTDDYYTVLGWLVHNNQMCPTFKRP